MKYMETILKLFLLCTPMIIGMGKPVKSNQWVLYQSYNNQIDVQSTYFDKQGRLVICKKNDIDQIDIQSNSIVSINHHTPQNDLLIKKEIPLSHSKYYKVKNYNSAYLLRNGQFLAWSTSDATRKEHLTKAAYAITFENSLSEQKKVLLEAIPASDSKNQPQGVLLDNGDTLGVIPAFDSKNQPNYLLFGSDCLLAPNQFDAQEQFFAISNHTQIAICKIDPNHNLSREYSFIYECGHRIISLCFHPTKKIVAALSKDSHNSQSHVFVFDLNTKKNLFSLLLKKTAYSLCFNKDEYLAVAAGNTIEIINLANQKVKKRVSIGSATNIFSCCFHPTENILAMLGNNRSGSVLQLINLDNNALSTFEHNSINAPLCCFDSTGDYLVTTEKDSIKIYTHQT